MSAATSPDLTIQNLTYGLYQRMPGAPQPPTADGWPALGEVMGNPHWEFCEAIVRVSIHVAQAYSR